VALGAVVDAAVDGVGEVDAYLLGGHELAIDVHCFGFGQRNILSRWQSVCRVARERRTSIYLGL
jgi:hypothetical protein